MEQAVEIEEKVIEGCKRLGPSGEELLCKAVEHLEKMKKIMAFPEWATHCAVADLLGAKLGI